MAAEPIFEYTCLKGWLMAPSIEDGSMVPFFMQVRSNDIHYAPSYGLGWTTRLSNASKTIISSYKGMIGKSMYLEAYNGNKYKTTVFFPCNVVTTDGFNISITTDMQTPNLSNSIVNSSLIYADTNHTIAAGVTITITNPNAAFTTTDIPPASASDGLFSAIYISIEGTAHGPLECELTAYGSPDGYMIYDKLDTATSPNDVLYLLEEDSLEIVNSFVGPKSVPANKVLTNNGSTRILQVRPSEESIIIS